MDDIKSRAVEWVGWDRAERARVWCYHPPELSNQDTMAKVWEAIDSNRAAYKEAEKAGLTKAPTPEEVAFIYEMVGTDVADSKLHANMALLREPPAKHWAALKPALQQIVNAKARVEAKMRREGRASARPAVAFGLACGMCGDGIAQVLSGWDLDLYIAIEMSEGAVDTGHQWLEDLGVEVVHVAVDFYNPAMLEFVDAIFKEAPWVQDSVTSVVISTPCTNTSHAMEKREVYEMDGSRGDQLLMLGVCCTWSRPSFSERCR